jgi:hypothetical protein
MVREGNSVSNRAKIEAAPENQRCSSLPNRRRRLFEDVGQAKIYPTLSEKRRLLK